MDQTSSAERLNYLVPLLHFSFKNFKDSKCWSFIRFQFVLHGPAGFLTFSQNVQRLQKVDIISWRGHQFCKMTEWPLRVSLTKTWGASIVSQTECLRLISVGLSTSKFWKIKEEGVILWGRQIFWPPSFLLEF